MTTARYNRVTFGEVATFATTAPSSLNSMTHIPAIDPAAPSVVQSFDEGNETAGDGSMSVKYPTAKDATWELTARVYTGDKSIASSGTDATSAYLWKLIDSYFGMAADTSGAGTTVASGTGSAPVMTLITGINAGNALMFGGSGTDGSVRFVAAVSGSTVTPDDTIDTAADFAAAAEVYSAFNWAPVMGAYAPHVYFNWEGADHQWLVGPGKITSFKLSGLAAREGCRYAMGFSGDTYAGGFTSGTFTPNAYTGSPLVSVGATCNINGTDTAVGDFEIDFGVKHEPVTATSGTNGRAGWEITEVAPTGSFTEYYASGRWTQYAAATSIPLRFVIPVSTSGHVAKAKGTIAVWFPNCNLTVCGGVLNWQLAGWVACQARRPPTARQANSVVSPVYFSVFGGT